jgi:hypothetical protein
MVRRSLPPKAGRLAAQIERAKRLAAESMPLVAALYEVHLRLCEENLSEKGQGVKSPSPQRPNSSPSSRFPALQDRHR